jgi:predicted RNase H-like nuclease (RuvC/YqgF family)
MDVYDDLAEATQRAWDTEQEVMRLELRIDNLLDKISRLEEEIEALRGKKVESICRHCGVTFSQRHKGRTRKYCSNACKQAHYRGRKDFEDYMSALKTPELLRDMEEFLPGDMTEYFVNNQAMFSPLSVFTKKKNDQPDPGPENDSSTKGLKCR